MSWTAMIEAIEHICRSARAETATELAGELDGATAALNDLHNERIREIQASHDCYSAPEMASHRDTSECRDGEPVPGAPLFTESEVFQIAGYLSVQWAPHDSDGGKLADDVKAAVARVLEADEGPSDDRPDRPDEIACDGAETKSIGAPTIVVNISADSTRLHFELARVEARVARFAGRIQAAAALVLGEHQGQ